MDAGDSDLRLRRFALEPYDDQSLGEEVGVLDENPLGIHDDSELSLAGLQHKLLLVKTQNGWARSGPSAGRCVVISSRPATDSRHVAVRHTKKSYNMYLRS